jgi:hypothetical protein
VRTYDRADSPQWNLGPRFAATGPSDGPLPMMRFGGDHPVGASRRGTRRPDGPSQPTSSPSRRWSAVSPDTRLRAVFRGIRALARCRDRGLGARVVRRSPLAVPGARRRGTDNPAPISIRRDRALRVRCSALPAAVPTPWRDAPAGRRRRVRAAGRSDARRGVRQELARDLVGVACVDGDRVRADPGHRSEQLPARALGHGRVRRTLSAADARTH